jgi:propionyl-CoA carboxylase alpha chain
MGVKMGDRTFAVALAEDEITVDGEPVDSPWNIRRASKLVEAEIGDETITVKIEPMRTGLKMTTRGAIHKVQILPASIAPSGRRT